jgi:hypothetical protein
MITGLTQAVRRQLYLDRQRVLASRHARRARKQAADDRIAELMAKLEHIERKQSWTKNALKQMAE